MIATIVGAYPRIGSEHGDRLRRELNILYRGTGDPELVKSLMESLTKEIVREMVSAGIDLPNYGLIDLQDEVTGHLEGKVDGIRPDGIEKTFHTNILFRRAEVRGRINRTGSLVSDLYWIAKKEHPQTKLEFTGPYTLAQHSVLVKGSPYKNFRELVQAYAKLYRQELLELEDVPWVQFDEPSIVAYGADGKNLGVLRQVYRTMLDGVQIPVGLWTSYGRYSPRLLNALFSLPNVRSVGLDFVWDPAVEALLGRRLSREPTDKGIGFGIVDSGDRGYIISEEPQSVAQRLRRLIERWEGRFDFENSFVSGNATFEHLPRDIAERKLRLIAGIARRVNE